MIPQLLVKNDLKSIFKNGDKAIFEGGNEIYGYLNKSTKVFFNDALSGEAITFLICKNDTPELKTILNINEVIYEIYKIDHENEHLTRLFLRIFK